MRTEVETDNSGEREREWDEHREERERERSQLCFNMEIVGKFGGRGWREKCRARKREIRIMNIFDFAGALCIGILFPLNYYLKRKDGAFFPSRDYQVGQQSPRTFLSFPPPPTITSGLESFCCVKGAGR